MSKENDILLDVKNLRIGFRQGGTIARAVEDTSFSIRRGELLALVGESGSGKSVTAMSLLGLLPEVSAVISNGTAMFDGHDLLKMSRKELNEIRGNRISMIFQEPMTALNPVLTIGWQIGEVLRRHRGLDKEETQKQVVELLRKVGIPSPEKRAEDYPHQLSGGMRQRVMIAIALACRPELLIADEPTTALDVTVQAQIMDLLAELRTEYKTSVLFITHNLALVREQADRVAVMYAGSIMEQGTCEEIFKAPMHPYTRLLMQSVPSTTQRGRRLASIAGMVPKGTDVIPGCGFASRCPFKTDACDAQKPLLETLEGVHEVACLRLKELRQLEKSSDKAENVHSQNGQTVLTVNGLRVWFPVKAGILKRTVGHVKAVDGISFELKKGETLAVVGESGCGKTTIGKSIVGLAPRTEGDVMLADGDGKMTQPDMATLRQRVQMIFQDPFSSLDPRLMVGETIEEGMEVHGVGKDAAERRALMEKLSIRVGLSPDVLNRYPHQFSGGQRQRIGLARALAVNPEVIICDECTSALDVSVQAQILNLLKELQDELGLSYLFITHDLSVVSYLADRVAVMYLGRIVEEGAAADVLETPKHPYTKALMAAAPRVEADGKRTVLRLAGEVPSALNPPKGCHFHPRCPHCTEKCRLETPPVKELANGQRVCCWLDMETEDNK
ncbi:MAG: dipeptide ABC transporter ATP-binding protein [Victivallales bacterium]|nr:dipeptide ABC transporter ATP-binding protein [Victivallales bacterium]